MALLERTRSEEMPQRVRGAPDPKGTEVVPQLMADIPRGDALARSVHEQWTPVGHPVGLERLKNLSMQGDQPLVSSLGFNDPEKPLRGQHVLSGEPSDLLAPEALKSPQEEPQAVQRGRLGEGSREIRVGDGSREIPAQLGGTDARGRVGRNQSRLDLPSVETSQV